MKTLPSLALLAAVTALIALPLSLEITVSLLLVAGFASILVSDYTRPARLRRVPAMVPVGAIAEPRTSAFRLAA